MDGNNNNMNSSNISMKQMVGIMGGKGNPHPLYKEREVVGGKGSPHPLYKEREMVEVCRTPDDEQNLRYKDSKKQ